MQCFLGENVLSVPDWCRAQRLCSRPLPWLLLKMVETADLGKHWLKISVPWHPHPLLLRYSTGTLLTWLNMTHSNFWFYSVCHWIPALHHSPLFFSTFHILLLSSNIVLSTWTYCIKKILKMMPRHPPSLFIQYKTFTSYMTQHKPQQPQHQYSESYLYMLH